MKLKLISASVFSGILLYLAWSSFGLGPILFIALLPLLYVDNYIHDNADKLKSVNIFLYSYLTF
ncbi:MAG: hypothetical protein QM500_00130, partial [Methylococcales bacterium]